MDAREENVFNKYNIWFQHRQTKDKFNYNSADSCNNCGGCGSCSSS